MKLFFLLLLFGLHAAIGQAQVFTGPPRPGVTSMYTHNATVVADYTRTTTTIAGKPLLRVGTSFQVAAPGVISQLWMYTIFATREVSLRLFQVDNQSVYTEIASVSVVTGSSGTRWTAGNITDTQVDPSFTYVVDARFVTGTSHFPDSPYCSVNDIQPDLSGYLYNVRGEFLSNETTPTRYAVDRNFWLDVSFQPLDVASPTTAIVTACPALATFAGPPLPGLSSMYSQLGDPVDAFELAAPIEGTAVYAVGMTFQVTTPGVITRRYTYTLPSRSIVLFLARFYNKGTPDVVAWKLDNFPSISSVQGGWTSTSASAVSVVPGVKYTLVATNGGAPMLLPNGSYCRQWERQPDQSGYLYDVQSEYFTNVNLNGPYYPTNRNFWLDVDFTPTNSLAATSGHTANCTGFYGPSRPGTTSTYNQIGIPFSLVPTSTIAGQPVSAVGASFRVATAGNITMMSAYTSEPEVALLYRVTGTRYTLLFSAGAGTEPGTRWVNTSATFMSFPVLPGQLYAVLVTRNGAPTDVPNSSYCDPREAQPDMSGHIFDVQGVFKGAGTSFFRIDRNFWVDVHFVPNDALAPTTGYSDRCTSSSSSTGPSSSTEDPSSSSSSTGESSSSTGSSSSSSGPESSSSSSTGSSTGTVESVPWVPPPFVNETVVDPLVNETSAVVVFDMDFDSIADMDLFKISFVEELDRVAGNPEGTTSPDAVNSVVAGSIIVNVTVGLTAAQVLQQFSAAFLNSTVTVDPNEYPLFSRTSQPVVVQTFPSCGSSGCYPVVDRTRVELQNYDATCSATLANRQTVGAYNQSKLYPAYDCLGVTGPTGQCFDGQCGCTPTPDGTCDLSTMPYGSTIHVQPGVVCVAGASRNFADVCVSTENTLDQLSYITTSRLPEYAPTPTAYPLPGSETQFLRPTTGISYPVNVTDECSYRDARYVNIFPRRRWCQHRNYGLNLDVSTHQGALGNVFNSSAPLRIFQLQFPIPLSQLLVGDYEGGVSALPDTAGQAYRDLLSVVSLDSNGVNPTSWDPPGIFYGYISNLYDSDPGQSSFNKVWAYMRISMYLRSNKLVQLQQLTFLDSVEGAADRYFSGGRWNYFDCSTIGWTGRTYAYRNDTDGEPACDCQLWHQREPRTGVCEPGCPPGFFGQDCTTVTSTDVNCPYVVNNATLYQRATTCEPVCAVAWVLGASGFCVRAPLVEEEEPRMGTALVQTKKKENDNVLAVVLLVLGAAAALGVFSFAMWRVQPWRRFLSNNKIKQEPPPVPHRPKVSKKKVMARLDVFQDISRLHNSLSEQSTSRELLNI